MMQVNKKYALWILVFVAASLITVLFLGPAGISVGNLLFVTASLLFYAVPIAIVVYVISLVKRYVDCKVMESEKVVETDAKIELLKQEIKRIGSNVDEIAENHG
ncbi:MAG: hypothetical protein BA871_15430 [Desulfuromonadales bacterium C00003096]|jgi:hypothetical protein|nr:MAG: hypothetical protein BA871_15430 [Desulfuromonadales bacterium C00003096]